MGNLWLEPVGQAQSLSIPLSIIRAVGTFLPDPSLPSPRFLAQCTQYRGLCLGLPLGHWIVGQGLAWMLGAPSLGCF